MTSGEMAKGETLFSGRWYVLPFIVDLILSFRLRRSSKKAFFRLPLPLVRSNFLHGNSRFGVVDSGAGIAFRIPVGRRQRRQRRRRRLPLLPVLPREIARRLPEETAVENDK